MKIVCYTLSCVARSCSAAVHALFVSCSGVVVCTLGGVRIGVAFYLHIAVCLCCPGEDGLEVSQGLYILFAHVDWRVSAECLPHSVGSGDYCF